MRFKEPLLAATLVRRYQRFLADVELADGTVVTVHCPNSGRMTTCSEPGSPVLISDSGNPRRKLRYTWEMIRMGRTWVGVNTANPNRAVASFVRRGRIPELAGYTEILREVPYGVEGRSRIDLLLRAPGRRDCYLEIKNSTLRTGIHAAFPDAVTERGLKHLRELVSVVEEGRRAVIFFFVGRGDCRRFRPADEVHPEYGAVLRDVTSAGVEVLAWRHRFSPREIRLVDRLPVDL